MYYGAEDYKPIDILAVLKKLLSHKKQLLIWLCGGVLFGMMVCICTPKTFQSSARIAPEVAARNSSSNSLSTLASMAGINIGGVTTSDAMQPDLYPEIVNSTPFLADLFPVQVNFSAKGKSVQTDIYDYFCTYFKEPWWIKLKRVPVKLTSKIKGLFKEKRTPAHGYDDLNLARLTPEQARVLRRMRESILITSDKKTNVITVAVTTQNPGVSALLATEVVERIKSYVTQYRTDKARHDLEYYQQLYDDAQQAYYTAQQKYARYVDANQGVVLQRVKIEEQRLQNESNLAYQLYNSCAQQVQMAKAKVQQDTPVCSVIQPPTYPLLKSAPSAMKCIVISTFLALLCICFWILAGKKWVADYKAKTVE